MFCFAFFAVYPEILNPEVLCVPSHKLVYVLPEELVTTQINKVNEIADAINICTLFIKQIMCFILTRIQSCNSGIVWFPLALFGNRKDRERYIQRSNI